jgi:Holliday junction resolvase RusA-like endonuclease
MSGGHFEYKQYDIFEIAREIERLIKFNDSDQVNEYGDRISRISREYSGETITKFKIAIDILSQAAIMAQRIDWLVSGDDGEETFHQRWDEDLTNLLDLLGEGLEEHA